MTRPGVSVVVCTHNGAARLPPTLAHLAAQSADVPWEVILVDNASTDNVAEVAARHWPSRSGAPLRVVSETRLGLSNARRCGLAMAAYPIVAFVDDDNWLAPDWVATAARLMSELPDVAALGGFVEPASEQPLPSWFDRFKQCYAVGAQADTAGEIGWERGYVWGAGLVVRRDALRELFAEGFEPRLTGRSGGRLSAGEDGELCLALMLAGWKVWYDPALRLKHFLPAHRLQWGYLKRMWAGFGRASVILDVYRHVPARARRQRIGQTWLWHALVACKDVCWKHNPLKPLLQPPYSWDEVLFQFHWSRCLELLRVNFGYELAVRETRRARWAQHRPRRA